MACTLCQVVILPHLKRWKYQFPTVLNFSKKCPLEDFDGFGVVRILIKKTPCTVKPDSDTTGTRVSLYIVGTCLMWTLVIMGVQPRHTGSTTRVMKIFASHEWVHRWEEVRVPIDLRLLLHLFGGRVQLGNVGGVIQDSRCIIIKEGGEIAAGPVVLRAERWINWRYEYSWQWVQVTGYWLQWIVNRFLMYYIYFPTQITNM